MRQRLNALIHRVGTSLMLRSAGQAQLAWVVGIAGPLLVAAAFAPFRPSIGLAGFLFGTLLFVVAAAVMGGLRPALVGAAIAIPPGVYYFAPPYDNLAIEREGDLFVFIGFIVVAAVLGILVDQLVGLARQQAALRRVATLVAHAATADELFAAVTEEVGQQLPVDFTRMIRYEPGDWMTLVAAWSTPNDGFAVGTRVKLEGKSVSTIVWRTGRPARMDNFDDLSSPHTVNAQRLGLRSVVGVPIVVEGRIWGVMIAGSTVRGQLPPDAEARLAAFTDLLSTAIANAESRTELAASRARIVAAADETRRRIERDLHDGTQQRLVSLAIELRMAESRIPSDLPEARAMLFGAAKDLTDAVADLQEISRGIHPAILSKGGLTPAIKTLARRSAVAVELDVQVERRLPQQVEVAAYYVVSEALTNVAKYAHASLVNVDVHASDSAIELAVRDDGIGGADPTRGSGLVGLKDRVEALGGTITVAGGSGQGTSVVARIPIDRKSGIDAERRQAIVR
jgi:signal transduction histidine kinase